jgi:prepilin-type N-terminal cleavage/methylation domain-containing protein/prepilin-type processing-associated H-X9-DG protein
MKANCKLKQGFTLIELLVVIGVITVLLAILLPGLRAARRQCQRVVCASQMHQLGMAHVMYQQSYEGWIVPATQELGVDEYWYNTLGPYFEHDNVGHASENPDDIGREILKCPLDHAAYPKMLNPHGNNPDGWLSYAINSQPTRHVSSRTKKYAGVGGNKIVSVQNPASTMLHCDFAYRAWVCDSVTLTRNRYGSEPGAHYDAMSGYPEQNKTVEKAYRHSKRINILWVDSHVSLLKGKIPSAEEQTKFWGPLYDALALD